MTDDLTAELALLKVLLREREYSLQTKRQQAEDLKNKNAELSAENERLKALLVECEKVVKLAVDAAENFPDVHDGRVEPLQMIEHLHEWEAEHLGFGKIAGADDLLTKLHAAGIGGE